MHKMNRYLRSIYVRLFRFFNSARFQAFGQGVYIFPGVYIDGEQAISLGDNVVVQDGTALIFHYRPQECEPVGIKIGFGTNIGRRNHIYALNEVIIGNSVLTGPNVYISDCTHEFLDTTQPVIDQPIKALKSVVIGDGTWVGQGACIIGCNIGRNCVIGANSVVLKDVADYSVVVGSPARVIRQFDPGTQQWTKYGITTAMDNQ